MWLAVEEAAVGAGHPPLRFARRVGTLRRCLLPFGTLRRAATPPFYASQRTPVARRRVRYRHGRQIRRCAAVS